MNLIIVCVVFVEYIKETNMHLDESTKMEKYESVRCLSQFSFVLSVCDHESEL